jgi:P-type Cu2+ transporter
VLLLVASSTFFVMLPDGMSVALERAIAVLIISCPCALALAAPAAQARAFAGLLSRGIVLRRVAALDRIGQADYFLLDKTGTLTAPKLLGLSGLRGDFTQKRARELIAVLEASANHPLSVALRTVAAPESGGLAVQDLHWTPGEGVSGIVDGTEFRLGRARFVRELAKCPTLDSDEAHLWLADDSGIICTIELGETLRPGATELVAALKRRGVVEILSGDHEDKTKHIAALLDIQATPGAQTPENKATRVKVLQQAGRTVAMIGDGVNDSVSFAGADVAISVGAATDAARASADIVCATDDLSTVIECIDYANRAQRVMQSNFAWAIAYNVIAIPFAVAGLINPLVASVGMATSSAFVMLNVMRLDVRAA